MIIEQSLRLIKGANAKESLQKNIALFVNRLEEYVLKYASHYINFVAFRSFMQEQGDIPFLLKELSDENIASSTSV